MLRAPARYAGLAVSTTALAVVGTFFAISPAQSDGDRHRDHRDRDRHTELEADLNGRNELDATTLARGAGDPDGDGDAEVDINRRSDTGMVKLCWEIDVDDIADATRAHIHAGDKRVNGDIVVAFFETDQPQMFEGCTLVEENLARDIRQHPREYYVNVHNADFPGGAVRGQLKRD